MSFLRRRVQPKLHRLQHCRCFFPAQQVTTCYTKFDEREQVWRVTICHHLSSTEVILLPSPAIDRNRTSLKHHATATRNSLFLFSFLRISRYRVLVPAYSTDVLPLTYRFGTDRIAPYRPCPPPQPRPAAPAFPRRRPPPRPPRSLHPRRAPRPHERRRPPPPHAVRDSGPHGRRRRRRRRRQRTAIRLRRRVVGRERCAADNAVTSGRGDAAANRFRRRKPDRGPVQAPPPSKTHTHLSRSRILPRFSGSLSLSLFLSLSLSHTHTHTHSLTHSHTAHTHTHTYIFCV